MARFVVSVAGAAVVAAALASCSSNNSGTNSSPAASSAAASGTAGPSGNRVLVDGQDQGAVEHVRCGPVSTAGSDGVGIKIGMGDHGVDALLINTDPPQVQTLHFSNFLSGGVSAGVGLAYEAGQSEGSAAASKLGNTYTITGTATGMSQSTGQVSKSFEIDVTCP